MNEELYYDIDKIVYVDTSNGGHWTYTVRDFLNLLAKGKVVTCVYCGQEYPSGTPTSQHELLTEHIKVCKKHPMYRISLENKLLKNQYELLVLVFKDLYHTLPKERMKNAFKLDLLDMLPTDVFEDIFGKHPVVET